MTKPQNRLILVVLVLFIISNLVSFPTRASPSLQAMDHFVFVPFITYSPPPLRKVNIPDFGPEDVVTQNYSEMAIFWFGQISPSNSYSDVRIGYNDTSLVLLLNIFDRRLWYDTSPSPSDLTLYDSATVSLSKSSSIQDAYRFTAQLNAGQPMTNWQLSERGTSSGWTIISPPNFSATTGSLWEDYTTGGLNIDENNRGWTTTITIPFTSLGLSGKPAQGTEWKLTVAVHDRDDSSGSVILESTWPENIQSSQPRTWGGLHFGLPSYTPPSLNPAGSAVIRNKLNGAVVPDADVGGTSGNLCPSDPWYIWNAWANENHGFTGDFNIQNQSNLADWPCFSKYYVTFPLSSLPANKAILNATLTLHQWGNTGPLDLAQPSYIQVFTVNQPWSESTLTWNNAPLALENVSQAWVNPTQPCGGPGQLSWPCTPRSWDVTRAVVDAYQSGTPLNLAFYSSDSAMHSGKLFTSSNVADWDAVGRPTLVVTWGNP